VDLAGKKLGVLLSTAPTHPNLETAVRLAEEALRRGATPYLYLIDDAVGALGDPRVRQLPTRGARLFACAYGRLKRGLALEELEGVTYCGLVVLADVISGTDRFIALN
jgi:sulfur relay (sulfurtransferase) complex TusBCD TusD component (DsrE family)